MKWGFPENVSTYGDRLDGMYTMILIVTAVMFVIVELALLFFVFKYRARPGRKAAFIHGNPRAEVVWTVVPFVGVAFLAFASAGTWLDIKRPDRFPTTGLEIRVMASQFEWNVTYPGADGRLGTPDDFIKRNQLHLPEGVPIRANLEAEDVIHSFFLPEFRVKQDAVPGLVQQVWFQATRSGTFTLGCAELCGLGHYRMKGTVTVHPREAFDRWVGEQVAGSRPTATAAAAP